MVKLLLISWLLVGFGAWLGLSIPKWNRMLDWYYTRQIIAGFFMTLILFPISLYNNRDKTSRKIPKGWRKNNGN